MQRFAVVRAAVLRSYLVRSVFPGYRPVVCLVSAYVASMWIVTVP
jgi:hypothetical protein